MHPRVIIDTARERRLDAIAVTDHDTIRGGLETKKLAKDLTVFVGSEIKTRSGEIIGIKLKRDVASGMSPEETCEAIKKQGGFIIVPHPFDRTRRGMGDSINEVKELIDAVEVFNSRVVFSRFNKRADEFARDNKLPGVAGSDSHFREEIGCAWTKVASPNDEDSILEAVKKGRLRVEGRGSGLGPHWRTFRKNLSNKI